MRLLLVSATSTVPSRPRQRPPGSESCAAPPAPSASPGVPLPATVLIVSLFVSSTYSMQHGTTQAAEASVKSFAW